MTQTVDKFLDLKESMKGIAYHSNPNLLCLLTSTVVDREMERRGGGGTLVKEYEEKVHPTFHGTVKKIILMTSDLPLCFCHLPTRALALAQDICPLSFHVGLGLRSRSQTGLACWWCALKSMISAAV